MRMSPGNSGASGTQNGHGPHDDDDDDDDDFATLRLSTLGQLIASVRRAIRAPVKSGRSGPTAASAA